MKKLLLFVFLFAPFLGSAQTLEAATINSFSTYSQNLDGAGGMPILFYSQVTDNYLISAYSFNSNSSIIEQITLNDLSIYPNPAVDYVKFETEQAEIIVLNVLGEEVLRERNKSKINVSSLSPGIYFVLTVKTNGNATKQFVKL
jgi:hypothetical protein